jgi:hypothetical protein
MTSLFIVAPLERISRVQASAIRRQHASIKAEVSMLKAIQAKRPSRQAGKFVRLGSLAASQMQPRLAALASNQLMG